MQACSWALLDILLYWQFESLFPSLLLILLLIYVEKMGLKCRGYQTVEFGHQGKQYGAMQKKEGIEICCPIMKCLYCQ